MSVYVKIIG